MTLKKFFLIILLPAMFSHQTIAQIKSIDTDALVEMMEGSFSSEQQSKSDPDYSDVRLHIKRIWPEISSAYWLYAEYSLAGSPEKPIGQKVFGMTNTYEGRFKITTYTFEDPSRYSGEWSKENPLSQLAPDSLKLSEGCFVVVTLMNDNTYEGSSEGIDCGTDLRSAKYETTELKIGQDKIISWTRGYDENGQQMWGSKKGGYIFERIND